MFFFSPICLHSSRRILFVKIKKLHTPVLAQSVIDFLQPKKEQIFIDMTFGAGGHTECILNSAPNTKVFALDRDPTAFKIANDLSQRYPNRVVPLLGKFSDLPSLLHEEKVKPSSIDGILFDLGCSSMQFDEAYRGFSVSKDGPLDMRMDGNRLPNSITAADVLAKIEEHDLARILSVYGEEKLAKKIARAVIESRYMLLKLQTTHQLAELVAGIFDSDKRKDKLKRPAHVATKTFQALRIFVNNELNELNYGMTIAHRYMKVGGKIVILSFHSLEDRIVKCHLNENMAYNSGKLMGLKGFDPTFYCDEKELASLKSDIWKPLLKHVLIPSSDEMTDNPRSRSAKLRAAEKIK
ncbi:hypothetical protein R5R35_000823 [Gryllus longicercus]|uniref:Methyltransferase-like protein 15 homolog n=2 Tax=Gryllus longicercus TaxID=2509291 RepID=A0AAN9YVS4_9ORTH